MIAGPQKTTESNVHRASVLRFVRCYPARTIIFFAALIACVALTGPALVVSREPC